MLARVEEEFADAPIALDEGNCLILVALDVQIVVHFASVRFSALPPRLQALLEAAPLEACEHEDALDIRPGRKLDVVREEDDLPCCMLPAEDRIAALSELSRAVSHGPSESDAVHDFAVTQAIVSSVPSLPVFRSALAVLLQWATARGFLGSVRALPSALAWMALLARIHSLFPQAKEAALLLRLFLFLKKWDTSHALLLNRPGDEGSRDETVGRPVRETSAPRRRGAERKQER